MTSNWIRYFRRKFFLLLFAVFILCIYLSAIILRINNVNNKIMCYKNVEANESVPTSIVYFDDILNAKKQPIPGAAIFFHETSCSETGLVKLNAK